MAGLGSILITAGRRLINVCIYIILSTEKKIIYDRHVSSFRGLAMMVAALHNNIDEI